MPRGIDPNSIADLVTLEQEAGFPIGELPSGVSVAGNVRSALRKLARAYGLPAGIMSSDHLRTLWNAASRINHAARRAAADTLRASYPETTGDTPRPVPAPVPTPAPVTPTPTPPTPKEEPVDTTPTPTAPADIDAAKEAARKMAEAMSIIAGMSASKPGALDEAAIIALIHEHAPKAPEVRITVATPTGPVTIPGDKPRHNVFPRVLRALLAGCNVMLVGPAGSGKTTIAEQCAEAIAAATGHETPFYFNGAITSEYKLSGFIDAQGRIVSTAFRRAYEDGGVYLFDEVDASLPQALLAFNAALANGFYDFPDGVVRRHPNFRCIAAANTYGRGADRQYVGRNQLDAASIDRFVFVTMDYDETLERALSPNAEWTDHVQSVRTAVARAKVRHVVSPRATFAGAALLAAGAPWWEVEEDVIWKGLPDEDRAKVRATM